MSKRESVGARVTTETRGMTDKRVIIRRMIVGLTIAAMAFSGMAFGVAEEQRVYIAGQWKYTLTDKGAMIAGYGDGEPRGDILIPAEVDGHPVVGIAKRGFKDCASLTGVTLPDSVESIGEFAFFQCAGLTDITLPEGLKAIGGNAFDRCTALTDITLPGSLQSLGASAFACCEGLTDITIPQGVENVGVTAFFECTGLTSVTLAEGIKSIDEYAFVGCEGLTSITLPASLERIGKGAFDGCGLTRFDVSPDSRSYQAIDGVLFDKAVKTLVAYPKAREGEYVVPPTVETIGDSAFDVCGGLTDISFPDSVKTIGDSAFAYCSGLTSLTLPDSVETIGDNAFWACSMLYDLTLPNSVESIGKSAFASCYSLTGVTIPSGVKTIGEEAFAWCHQLASITLEEGTESIGRGAFAGCKLEHVTLPDSVTSIAPYGFGPNHALPEAVRELVVSRQDPLINTYQYELEDGRAVITSCPVVIGAYEDRGLIVTIPGELDGYLVTGIAAGAFAGSQLGSVHVVVPASVTEIGEGAISDEGEVYAVIMGVTKDSAAEAYAKANDILHYFFDATGQWIYALEGEGARAVLIRCTQKAEGALQLPAEVDGYPVWSIEARLSENILYTESFLPEGSALVRLTIPEGVTSIGDNAFIGCEGLTEITLPDSLESIGDFAFWNCEGLSAISIPETVRSIGERVFAWCALSSFDVSPENACYEQSDGVLYEKGQRVLVAYPAAREGAYVIPQGVETIRDSAFCGCEGLTSVTIPKSVTVIGWGAFIGCGDMVLRVERGSYGEEYAEKQGIEYVYGQ